MKEEEAVEVELEKEVRRLSTRGGRGGQKSENFADIICEHSIT